MWQGCPCHIGGAARSRATRGGATGPAPGWPPRVGGWRPGRRATRGAWPAARGTSSGAGSAARPPSAPRAAGSARHPRATGRHRRRGSCPASATHGRRAPPATSEGLWGAPGAASPSDSDEPGCLCPRHALAPSQPNRPAGCWWEGSWARVAHPSARLASQRAGEPPGRVGDEAAQRRSLDARLAWCVLSS